MSALIDNIKRLAALVRGEKKSGGNTAERVGGLFEEIATELDKKYDRTESDQLMNAHNTGEASHLNIQQKLIQLIDETREALLAADHDITQELAAHTGIKAIHKTSEEIRAEIVDQDIPATLARVSYVQAQRTEILNIAKQLVTSEIAEVIGGAPDALNALNELAAAINNDPNFAASIMALINAKADLIHTHTKAQITDFPTSMPASDVYSWAKQPTKPAYSAAEVGASPANHNHAGTYQPAGSYAPANHTHEGVYQPAGSYSPANHNHAGTYQPAGNYAPANHGHGASAITEEANKLFMTSAERSKLAGIETSYRPLCVGRIDEKNVLTKLYGSISLTLERESDANGNPSGAYILKHNIDHTNYIVLISPSVIYETAAVVGLLANTFVIYMANNSGYVLKSTKFSFIVFPAN